MHQHCTIDSVERQGFMDSLLILERIYQQRHEDAQFHAALHGHQIE